MGRGRERLLAPLFSYSSLMCPKVSPQNHSHEHSMWERASFGTLTRAGSSNSNDWHVSAT